MQNTMKLAIVLMFGLVNAVAAQPADSEAEALEIAAIEALMVAPQSKALPIVARVLAGDKSDDVKSRALFVLSQIDLPEAQSILLDTARSGSPQLRLEAIRMIGISGDSEALAKLGAIYAGGDRQTKERVLQAYLIAGDANAVYELAVNAATEDEFEIAVQTLGAMGATDELRALRGESGMSETLIRAYSIAGDYESLREMALDDTDPRLQVKAIQSLGVVGGDDNNEILLQIYRDSDTKHVRDAALHGMMISGFDEGVAQLFRESNDPVEKRQFLRMLVTMDSDAALGIIDETLGDQ
ncbi:MAG: HEAT repeat domain-containing protein [Gammaproteobacteria bacterium]|nr:HEAT repeat domain-containing protein [Gammaproteobacteria bacterium]